MLKEVCIGLFDVVVQSQRVGNRRLFNVDFERYGSFFHILEKYLQFRKKQSMCQGTFFCSPGNWIYMFQNYFWNYAFLNAYSKLSRELQKFTLDQN